MRRHLTVAAVLVVALILCTAKAGAHVQSLTATPAVQVWRSPVLPLAFVHEEVWRQHAALPWHQPDFCTVTWHADGLRVRSNGCGKRLRLRYTATTRTHFRYRWHVSTG